MTFAKTMKHGRMAIVAALVAVLASLGALSAASAAPSAKDVVAARKANYKKMGAAVKALKDQLAQGTPAKAVLVSNAAIVAATAKEQGKMFPAGTGPGPGIATDALANIWTDRATFDTLMKEMVGETVKLQAVAGSGDVAAIRAQFKATGQSCAACHRKFRADS